jgi:polyhydroxybutyrate depolymerase
MNLLSRKTLALPLFILLLISSIAACQTQSTLESGAVAKKVSVTPKKQSISKGDYRGELLHQGRRRTYYLHTPKSYNPNRPMPLVLAFHGYGSQGKDLASNTGFSELAEQKGFIIVYPDGIDRQWNVASNPLFGVDDVSLVEALIEHLTQTLAIDRRRIYATGVSNGGFLVQRLACTQNQIAAFASVVATFPGELQSSCDRETPSSMLMINGTDDRKVPWSGERGVYGWMMSVPDSINFWRQHNGCTGKEVKQILNARVEISRYPNCRNNSEVELVVLKGVGHVWPRGGSGSQQLLNGSQEIWNFFQRHTLP